jgi:quinol-cytochrome oxidoreductase complex cytochrome b subunit
MYSRKVTCASTYFANNPLGISSNMDKLPIHPYFMYKDYVGVVVFAIAFSFIVFFYPNVLGHSDNYIPANPLVTPEHIVPEWYGFSAFQRFI